jgi:hypothetical protein
MHPTLLRIFRRALWCALLPASLLSGCRLSEQPIYPRLSYATNVRPIRVLFIGNSLTYYNDLPGLVQQFSAREEHPMVIDAVTVANATLDFHWNYSAAKKHLERGGWDYVVLQEYSTRPVTDRAATRDDYREWAAEVQRIGAKPIIFENWTHKLEEKNAGYMHQTYLLVHDDIGGQLSPIGQVWLRCLREHPEIPMYVDEKHPTTAGTYLAACVLYKTFYNKPATGLPTALPGLKLPADMAAKLQQVADTARDAR